MDEHCIDCGHEFDIHHLKNGMCSMCIDFEKDQENDFTISDYEDILIHRNKL